jgi:hypothetical protein
MTAEHVRSSYSAMLADIRAYLREMNVSEKLADDMLAIEPERIRVLTQSDLRGYGIAGLDPAKQQRLAIENEARDVAEAAQLGSTDANTPAERLSARASAYPRPPANR